MVQVLSTNGASTLHVANPTSRQCVDSSSPLYTSNFASGAERRRGLPVPRSVWFTSLREDLNHPHTAMMWDSTICTVDAPFVERTWKEPHTAVMWDSRYPGRCSFFVEGI